MISRIADWITIITGPLTVISVFATWFGKVDQTQDTEKQDSLTAYAIAILLIIVAWSFIFLAQLRLFAALSRKYEDIVTFVFSIVIGIGALAVFSAVELIILESLGFKLSDSTKITAWLIIPMGLWVIADFFAIIFIASGAAEKDAV